MAIVDIAVPCYRYGHFLQDCVSSVLSQSISDVRILIIDDASQDGSAEVARALAATDPRIEVSVHPTNRGQTATYNEGIAWATAPYFLLLSADDYLAPGALERAVAVMSAHPDVVMTYGDCAFEVAGEPPEVPDEAPGGPEWVVRDGRRFVEEVCRRARNFVFTPTVVVRAATQKQIGGYLASLPHACDMEMWLRFAAHGRIASTSRTQAVYRVHGANMSADHLRDVLSDYAQRAAAFDTFFATDGRRIAGSARLHAIARRRLAAAAFWTGVSQCCRGRRAVGAQALAFGLELNPNMRFAPPMTQLARVEGIDRKLLGVLSALWARTRSWARLRLALLIPHVRRQRRMRGRAARAERE